MFGNRSLSFYFPGGYTLGNMIVKVDNMIKNFQNKLDC